MGKIPRQWACRKFLTCWTVQRIVKGGGMQQDKAKRQRIFYLVFLVLAFCGCGSDDDDGVDLIFRPVDEGQVCGGLLGTPCKRGLYCDVEDLSCGAADQVGICKKIPEVCTQEYAPVCGCDDKTYGNACTAAANGQSLSAIGECPR